MEVRITIHYSGKTCLKTPVLQWIRLCSRGGTINRCIDICIDIYFSRDTYRNIIFYNHNFSLIFIFVYMYNDLN